MTTKPVEGLRLGMTNAEQTRFARDLLDVCVAMTRRGLRVDDELRQSRLAALTGEASQLQQQARPLIEAVKDRLKCSSLYFKSRVCRVCHNGKRKRLTCTACGTVGKFTNFECNLGSDSQLKDILYNALKLPRRSRDGHESTDEEALQSLVALDKSGLVLLALRYAKLATMAEIYTRLAPAADGHIRSVYNPAGTYTGRFSSKEGFYVDRSTNLQNLPGAEEGRRDPLYTVRDCIVPDVGEVFVEGDLSQAEARVVGALSQDDTLLERWRDPVWDVHKWTAAHVYDCPESGVTVAQRHVGKRARHALNYGEGPNKFWRVVNGDADVTGVAITLAEAKQIYAAYHRLHPTLDATWWNAVENALLRTGTLINCFGRQCRFYPRIDQDTEALDPDTLRAAIAYEPQSTVSQITKIGLLEMHRSENGAWRVLHEQHDSVLLGVPQHGVWRAAKALKRAMERPITVNGYALTIPCEVFLARERWSQKERLL